NAQQAVIGVEETLFYDHPEVVDADLADYFGSIPHAELLKSVARRIVDRRVLHLIKMWLECAVEETDDRGRKTRTTKAKDSGRGIPQGSPLTPWTQKRTSSLSAKLNCVVRRRSLIYAVRGNILMTYGPIHSRRKGSTVECCIRSDCQRVQPQRGRGSPGGAVQPITAPSLPLPARGAEHQASGGSLRADHSDHDQGSRRRGGQTAGLCTGQRSDDRRDGGARRIALSGQGKPAWLIAKGDANPCNWSTYLTAY